MSSKDTRIEYIESSQAAVFRRKYFYRDRPVIIRNLHRSNPISKVKCVSDLARTFGRVPLQFRSTNYYDDLSTRGSVPRQLTIQQYFGHLRHSPDSNLLCSEFGTPAEILREAPSPKIAESVSLYPIISRVFVGNGGGYATIHFDADYRHVLLHQVYGRKRIVLIRPDESEKLKPFFHFSEFNLSRFSPRDKRDFVRFTRAYDFILRPGETLFFPAGWWHYVEYLDASMSINYRFGETPLSRGLSRMRANRHALRFARYFGRSPSPQPDLWRSLLEVTSAFYSAEKYRSRCKTYLGSIRKAAIQAVESSTGNPYQDYFSESLSKEEETLLSSQPDKDWGLRSTPILVEDIRSRVTERQQKIVQDAINHSELPTSVVRRLASEYFGANRLSRLKQSEAAVLLGLL